MSTDVVPNIIIKGSNLSGRHIAAITNNTTLQHTGGGTGQPAYASNSQSSLPQTVESHMKSEYVHVPVDTGWIHPPPPEHNAGSPSANPGQLFGNFVHQPGNKLVQPSGGVVVPTASAPVTLGLAVHTHSPGGSHLIGSPGGHPHLPNPQGPGSSPRPQILRKRPHERRVVCCGLSLRPPLWFSLYGCVGVCVCGCALVGVCVGVGVSVGWGVWG